jgi:arylsulfatase A-like enzyme
MAGFVSRRPNIIVITSHDTGRHFGCYGVPTVHTPAIDAMAADGVLFSRMFATCSICTPSRGSLMTGQHPGTNGLYHLAGTNGDTQFDQPAHHLSNILRGNGYRTALIGHQHEASDLATLGFDDLPLGSQLPRATGVARVAGQYIKSMPHDGRPFYAQIGFFETHTKYDYDGVPPDDSRGLWLPPWTDASLDDDAVRKHVAGLQGSVRELDAAVGMILDALDAAGIADNTLVLFNVDHGVQLPLGKWTQYDGGTGIGFIIRWPRGGARGGRVCDALLSNIDFVPTLADLLGLRLPHSPDGVSFAAAVTGAGGEPSSPRDAIFTEFYGAQNFAARTATHKFIRNFWGSHFHPPDSELEHRNPLVELFDLRVDPLERDNLAFKPGHQAERDAMSALLWRHLKATNHPILLGPARNKGAQPGEPSERWRSAMADCPA